MPRKNTGANCWFSLRLSERSLEALRALAAEEETTVAALLREGARLVVAKRQRKT